MAGVAYTLQAPALDGLIGRLADYTAGRPARLAVLADAVGALLESSTKRRIADEKTAPDGTRWPGWSDAYGATRRRGQTLLVSEGDLRDSIQAYAMPGAVQVGSNLVYAAIHQFGGEEVGMPIPARPYLGLSAADEADVADLAEEFLRGGLE